MTVFAFWFDNNIELHYPFLGTRVIRGSRFFNDFTTQVNCYIGTTIVVPDSCVIQSKLKWKQHGSNRVESIESITIGYCSANNCLEPSASSRRARYALRGDPRIYILLCKYVPAGIYTYCAHTISLASTQSVHE